MEDETEWRSIAVGKRAELLLLSANPLEDLATADSASGRGSHLAESASAFVPGRIMDLIRSPRTR